MSKLPEYFNIGDQKDLDPESLLRLLERMYTTLAVAINKKPDVYQRDVDGQTTDTFLSNGDININLTNDKVEMLTNHPSATPTVVTWTELS